MDQNITQVKIHPAIGVARVGNSATEFFVGPESPDRLPGQPGFYKDAAGAIKRQAARFRGYGYNGAGEVVRELKLNEGGVERISVGSRPAAPFDAAPDTRNLINLQVPQAAFPHLSAAAGTWAAEGADAAAVEDALVGQAVRRAVAETRYSEEEISAGYDERLDPFHEGL
ncbi:LodA/GoxA family CTQ-dependent oxidase [Streptomyces sp. NPDC127033]|uniref:LodA/GoxA family CTQ-dependent oxidase n=1 Tax=Streptomyces sp. NPDC127033 TaxID=3347110 RepID=UPI00364DF6BC